MSAIIEALKGDYLPTLRVSGGSRWLIWHDFLERWVVYSREYRQRQTRTLIETEDEAEAVRYLIGEGITST